LEIFPEVVAEVSKVTEMRNLEAIFSSHQDPDICSSLNLWMNLNGDLKVYASWIWSKFIPHFGGGRSIVSIPDPGMVIPLNGSADLVAVPAHYCHSSGNFSVYDPTAKILFSGDIGAALMPDDMTALHVKDFDRHIAYMEGFHRRWMPSNRAKNAWIDRVSALDVQLMCPQHGALFTDGNIARFLEWFRGLEVGTGIA